MTEQFNPVPLNDLLTATAQGVLRALEARQMGLERMSAIDLVQSGFTVDIRIIAGGIRPFFLERQPAAPALLQTPS
ncbi:MAG: hypothetical protein ACREWG_07595 [Gammaproteobacteria bacterium]